MSTLKLPDRPSLDHLKHQAQDLRKAAKANGLPLSLAQAYHDLARNYGFASWPKLKAHVEFAGNVPAQAIIDAIHAGDPDLLRRLLVEHPAALSVTGPDGRGFLHYAAGSKASQNARRAQVLEILLDAGLPIEATAHSGEAGETPLHYAAMCPGADRVALLLARGASVYSIAGPAGGTPLVHALFHAKAENAQILAQVAVTPLNLRVAAGLGRIDLINALCRPDGTLTPEAGQHRAWHRPHKGFPAWKPSNDPKEILGDALMYAAINGRLETISLLLDRGADINARQYAGATALHWCATQGHQAAVELLLSRGANVDIRDEVYYGFPWGWAGQHSHTELERLLIRHSKTLDIFQACNFDAGIDRVRQILDRDPEALNRKQGDPPSCGRHKQGTALHEAVDWYKRDVVLLLLERGADVNARTAAGTTPLAIALERKNQEAADILRTRGGTT